MSTPKFLHDDLVTIPTGQVGTVKEVHEIEGTFVYKVQLRTQATEQFDVPETELALVKIANDDETGFAIRYIS
jgi:hypothetical protein